MQDKHVVTFSLKGIPSIEYFVQRSRDMQKIEDFLLPQQSDDHDRRRKILVVHGLGGIGKTQLCIEFVRRNRTEYTAVFWLDGSSENALQRSFMDTFTRLPAEEVQHSLVDASERASPDMPSRVAGVLAWLSLPSNYRWLLVIDNVDRDYMIEEKDSLAYDFKKYVPTADHGNIIVTSRLSTLIAPQNSLRLTRVDDSEGRAILVATGGEHVSAQDEIDIKSLLATLNGLPLALTQAGAYIRHTGVSIAEYMDHYKRTWQQLMEQQDQYSLQEYSNRSVLTTWKISYEQVRSQSEEAGSLLILWSFLYAGDLWHDLIAFSMELAPDVIVPKWLLLLAENKLEFNCAIGLLIKYSLVESRTGSVSYVMHSVLHSWCLNTAQIIGEKDIFKKMAVGSLGQAVSSVDMKQYWWRLLPHARVILHLIEGDIMAEPDVAELEAYLLLARFFEHQVRDAEIMEYLKHDLVEREKAMGHVSAPDTNNSPSSRRRLEEVEEMYTRARAGSERVLGPNHYLTLYAATCLGVIYARQGRPVEAKNMYKRALEGTKQELHEHTIAPMINASLGNLYFHQDRLEKAREMYERALAGYEEARGPEHTHTLSIVYSLGYVLETQGNPTKAKEMYERASAGYEKALGPRDYRTQNVVERLRSLDESSSSGASLYCEPADLESSDSRVTRIAPLLSLSSVTGPHASLSNAEEYEHRPRK